MRILRVGLRLLSASAVLVCVWQAIVFVFNPSDLVLPRPAAVVDALLREHHKYLRELRVTTVTALYGLICGVVLGAALALVRVLARYTGAIVEASAVIVRTLPVVAVAPLIAISFGTGIVSRIAVAALVSFFPVFSAIVYGTARIDREYLLLMELYQATRWQRLTQLQLPASVPFIASSLPMAATLAVLGTLVAEFCGSDEGLGLIVLRSLYRLDTVGLYGTVVLSGALGLSLYVAAMFPEVLMGRFLHNRIEDEQTMMLAFRRSAQ